MGAQAWITGTEKELFDYLRKNKIETRPLICGNMGQQPFMRSKQIIKQKLPRNKIANGEQFLGLFDFIVSENGNPLAGNSVVADFSETNSFRF